MPNGTSTNPVASAQSLSESTYPTIFIATLSAKMNAVTLQFEYLPENVSFGVTANFEPTQIQFTSGRWITYQNSDIEEVSLTVKVVAGCNNCITRFGGNLQNVTGSAPFRLFGGLTTGKYERNSLIVLAHLLYALPLPANNRWAEGEGAPYEPPPTCRLIVGRMFSGIGAFTGCSIAFNGPYDFDGSPTDMDVSLRFLPSEFYDSSGGILALPTNQQGQQTFTLEPKSSPTGESQVTGLYPYALAFGDIQSMVGQPGFTSTVAQAPPPKHVPTISNTSTVIPETGIKGPQTPTPSNDEAAIAMGFPPPPLTTVTYTPYPVDSYNFKDPNNTDPNYKGTDIKGEVVRTTVESQRGAAKGGL